ncbi:MAG: hypothetical protein GY862_12235 [Gammaproteobacteria bacterium]|nr:hypothetical protein [Gammaproteobacteria bacterium]
MIISATPGASPQALLPNFEGYEEHNEKKFSMFSYHHGRHNHLKKWREIRENLTRLAESFEVTSTPIKEE